MICHRPSKAVNEVLAKVIEIAAIALVAYLVLVGLVYIFQGYLTFAPDRSAIYPKDWQAEDMAVIQLHTADNLTLTSWYKAAAPGKPTLIYFHGNAGHIGGRVPVMRSYLNEGYGLLLVGYRGYANNPGTPTEQGLYQDARAGMAFLRQQGVNPECTVIYGESMGTGIAIQMATEYVIGALVLQSPYTSFVDVGKNHYPFLPVSWLIKNRFDSLSKIDQLKVPVFVGHGERDRVVPFSLGKQLYDTYQGPKTAYFAEGLGHDNIQDNIFYERVTGFLQQYLDGCVVTLN